jgi:hypothetical protein
LLGEDDVSGLRIFAFLDGVEHVVFDGVLAFQFENEAILKFIRFLFVVIWHLKLSVGLLDFLADHFEALGGHDEGLPPLADLLGIFVDGEVIIEFVFLFLEEFLEMFVVFSPQRHNHSYFSLLFPLCFLNTVELFMIEIDDLEGA